MNWRSTSTLSMLLLAAGCKGKSSCGLSLSDGPADSDRDIVVLGDRYNGPAFSELGDLEVVEDVVWFCSSVIGLNAYDASEPHKLRKLDDVAFSDGNRTYPRCHHLAVADSGEVYVSQRANSLSSESFLSTIDGSDPNHLVEISTQVRAENVEGLTVMGDHVLVAAHEAGLLVFDRVSNGGLADAGQLTEGLTNPWQVRTRGDLAYIADGEGGLAIVDVSDPSQPTLRSTLAVGGAAKDLVVSNDVVYLAAGATGVAVVDVSDPDVPLLIEIEDTPGSALAVALGNDALFVSDWNDVRVFDRSEPTDLTLRGHEPLTLSPGISSRSLGIAAAGDWFFSGNWTELVSYQHFPERQAPDLTTNPGLLLFGSAEPGDSTSALLELHNAGTEPVVLDQVKTSSKVLSVSNLPTGALQPGERHTMSVSLSPKNDTPFDGWLNLFSDDADQPKQCVRAEGNRGGMWIGDAVADIDFVSLDGDIVRLSDFTGQPVMLAYFATF